MSPDDFVVDEIAAYEPKGTGEHLYVHFRKRGAATLDAVRGIAERLGVSPKDVGTAGLKDRHAVTTQWASFPFPMKRELPDAAVVDAPDGSVVSLRIERHDNKLRTGHLRGNRFRLVLREVAAGDEDALLASFARIAEEGLPNWFGEQRFGRAGDNVTVALAWMRGETRPPRDTKVRRLQYSAVQSALFQRVLERRVEGGTWKRALVGDVLQKTESGGLFSCADPAVDQPRLDAREVVVTGPMFGEKMRAATDEAQIIEAEVLAESGIEPGLVATWSRLGEGTRRPLALFPSEMSTRRGEEPCSLVVDFVLAKGAYATSVLSEASSFRDASAFAAPASPFPHRHASPSSPPPDPSLPAPLGAAVLEASPIDQQEENG